jgi:hypothetical protein
MAKPLPTVNHRQPQALAGAGRRSAPRAAGPVRHASRPRPGGVRPRLIALAASMVIVFLLATTVFMTSNMATDLNILGVAGFAVIFFTLTLGLSNRAAHDPRWAGKAKRRHDNALVDDEVAIATGTIPGRAAMVQVLVLPVTLAIGMTVLALIFAMGL